jgi:hypothetical protein
MNAAVRLTPENANHYIGFEIVFKTRGRDIVKRITGVSASGRSVQIEHDDLHNSLNIVSRKVFVVV